MKKPVGLSLLIVAGLCVLLGVPAYEAEAQAAKSPVVWPAGDVKWSNNPAIKGAKIAVLWGDPKTGGYGALKTLPAGSTLALHTHTHDQRVLFLSGSLVLAMGGAAPKELAPVSYAFIPGGARHKAECKAGADCMYFEEQQGASDFKLVEGSAQR